MKKGRRKLTTNTCQLTIDYRLLAILSAVLFLLPVCAKATDITFTSSGTITDGNTYQSVYVNNNDTIVNMSGGRIMYYLTTRDASVFNMSDGLIKSTTQFVSSIMIIDSSTINISGGTIEAGFGLWGTMNSSGGNVTATNFKANPESVLNITGGVLDFSSLDIWGELNISGGLLNVDHIYTHGSASVVNISGYGFNYDPIGQILTGYLLDDNLFTINNLNNNDYQYFNFIPEPTSIILFSFVLLALRKPKK